MDFKYETITINKIDLNIIIDENNIKWYPLSRFFQKVLLKAEEAKNFNKTSISKDMRLWPIKEPTPAVTNIWYIKESTLIKILKNIQVNPYTSKTIERERALHGALKYFGINRQDRGNMYTVITPTKKEYTEWEMLCFEFDNDIKANIIWKMCDKCGRYFPCSKNYFQSKTYAKITNTCLECCGEEFINKNLDIQAMKNLNRMELVKYIREDKPISLYKEIEKEHFPYELHYFYNRTRILEVLKYIEGRKRVTGEGGFYLSKIASTLNMHTNKLKYIVGDNYEIGSTGPLPKHTYGYVPDDLTDEERKKKEFLDRNKEERKQAKRKRDIENYKEKLRMKHALKMKEETDNLIKWCKENNFEGVPKDAYSKTFTGIEYIFITPEGIHVLTHEPQEKKKIFIHKIPSKIDGFKKLRKEMEEAKKEYDN